MTACTHRKRRLSRAIELSVRGTELLTESNTLLRRIAEISQRTMESNHQYTQLLLNWSTSGSQHPLQSRYDKQASLDAAWRIAQRATRAALDIGVLVDGREPAWRRGIGDPAPPVTTLDDLAARIVAVTVQVERLARQPFSDRQELDSLVQAMHGMREIAERNIQVAQRSVTSVERIQGEALRFARKLAGR